MKRNEATIKIPISEYNLLKSSKTYKRQKLLLKID